MKNNTVLFVLVFSLNICIQAIDASTQSSDLKFKHISAEDLSQNGLNKYEGSTFTQYHNDPYDSTSILGIRNKRDKRR